jgi:hypothetical protein
MIQELEEEYLNTFYTDDDDELYGIRFATPKDAHQLVDLFIDVYDYEYLYPWVYDDASFKEVLADKNRYWCVVEHVKKELIVGSGALQKKDEFTLFGEKLLCRKNYQGKGLAGVLGTINMRTLYKMNVYEGALRLETDVRAKTFNSQKFIERSGCIPYAYIANFNNYGDKRNFNPSKGKPFNKGRLEPAIKYYKNFNDFWERRPKEIFLYDNEHIIKAYEILNHLNRREMKTDELAVKLKPDKKEIKKPSNELSEDFYKAIINITGYLDDIEQILQQYSDWNIIQWRIPTNTEQSIRYQKSAIDNGFHVVGYDPFAIHCDLFADAVLFNYYPNGVNFSQFEDISLTRKTKPFAELIMDSLHEFIG